MSEWQPIDTAPKDRIIWVYAPGVQELEPITCLCQWHDDGGFCVDEVRWPTLWQMPKLPAPPLTPEQELLNAYAEAAEMIARRRRADDDARYRQSVKTAWEG